MNELNEFVLFLKCLEGLGDKTIRKLIINGRLENVVFETQNDILQWFYKHSRLFPKKDFVENLSIKDIQIAREKRLIIEENLKKTGSSYISYFDPQYPRRFKAVQSVEQPKEFLFEEMNTIEPINSGPEDFPVILYYKGNISSLNNHHICAILGTREPDEKAKFLGMKLSELLSEKGNVIVSGLAKGCDSIGHIGCLNKRGITVAFLGTSIEKVYPAENKPLAEKIVNNGGALISEYAPFSQTFSYNFVERDRLQTMISDQVYVIQTSTTGGTMHAAKACEKYHKDLIVLDPNDLGMGDSSGNRLLIEKYNASIYRFR